MGMISFPSDIAGVLSVLNIIDIPAFVVTVDGDGVARFSGLNRAHEARTGLIGSEIAGFTPHEVLPPRIADTVMANYSRCIETCETLSYEEVLDLPAGRLWWRTTLSPIVERGRTAAIVGIAHDITELRNHLAEATHDMGDLRNRAEALQTLGRAIMTETRGPLNNVLALGRLLRAEFQPPMARKQDILDLMLDTAQSALIQIDDFEIQSEAAPSESLRTSTKVDLDHLCRDMAALIDPERNLSITFPEATIVADAAALHTSLQALLESAASRAQTYVQVTVGPDPRKPRTVLIRISFDPGRNAVQHADPAWLRAAVEARDGALRMGPARDGGGSEELYELSLPGRLSPGSNGRATPRAVNQQEWDLASG